MLRSYVVNPVRVEVLSAVVGVIGFVDAVIDYMAIRWWRTQHPQPVIAGGPDRKSTRLNSSHVSISYAVFCLKKKKKKKTKITAKKHDRQPQNNNKTRTD